MGVLVSTLAAKSDQIHAILEPILKYDQFLADLVSISKEYRSFLKSDSEETRKQVQTV